MLNTTKTSDLVSSQFPAFYREEGENFIAFVKAYYEWMALKGYDRASTSIPEALDIDDTQEKFLKNFRESYMDGLPEGLLGNQRLLQKHILDIYRSKGSIEGLRLIYRLIYNEDVEVYIPSYDIFKTSDGKWIKRPYLELNIHPDNKLFEGTRIIGNASGATAYVDVYERRVLNGIVVDILFLTDLSGNFFINENIFNDERPIVEDIYIKGSAGPFNVLSSAPNFKLGEKLHDLVNPRLKYVVTSINSFSDGVINPVITWGGKGYTLDANNLSITTSQSGNNVGTGFTIQIEEITDIEVITSSKVKLAAFANTALNAADYFMPGFGVDDINSPMGNALQVQDIEIGTISGIVTINPGSGYSEDVGIQVVDTLINPLQIQDIPTGTYYGNNAVLEGLVTIGNGLVKTVSIKNSDFNFVQGARRTLVSDENPNKRVIGDLNLSSIGTEEGFYRTTDSFVSSDKFIQDSYYYQEYSYEVTSTRTLSKYFNILKKLTHPVGNELFGAVLVTSNNTYTLNADHLTVVQE